MTKVSPDETQQTAQAVAVLYANWPAFRAWVDSGMSFGDRPRNGARPPPVLRGRLDPVNWMFFSDVGMSTQGRRGQPYGNSRNLPHNHLQLLPT